MPHIIVGRGSASAMGMAVEAGLESEIRIIEHTLGYTRCRGYSCDGQQARRVFT